MKHFALIISLTFSVLYSPKLFAQNIDSLGLHAFFQSLEKRDEAMASLAISKNGKLVYQKSIGNRFISGDKTFPADQFTRYRIWSITKVFTATMIFQLIEEGKLSLDTPLDTFFPSIQNSEKIKISHLLGHRSGIKDFTEDREPIWTGREDSVSPEEIVHMISGYPSVFEPGERFAYSNSNYLLLGYILEEIENDSYAQILKRRIRDSIGLTRTTYFESFPDSSKNESFSYLYDKGWKQVEEGHATGPIPAAAGEIISTPKDLLIFIEALFSHKLITKESLEKMTGLTHSHTLGIFPIDIHGHQGFGHSGDYMTHANLMYFPKDSLAIAYCSNGKRHDPGEIFQHIVTMAYGEPFRISYPRPWVLLGVTLLFVLLLIILRARNIHFPQQELLLSLSILFVYSIGQIIGVYLNGVDVSSLSLNGYYGNASTFMGIISSVLFVLCSLYFVIFFRKTYRSRPSKIPIFAILIFVIAHLGQALFPNPHALAMPFDMLPIFFSLGPILSMIFLAKSLTKPAWILSIFSICLSLIPVVLLLLGPPYDHYPNLYGSVFQRAIYVGGYIWLIALAISVSRISQEASEYVK